MDLREKKLHVVSETRIDIALFLVTEIIQNGIVQIGSYKAYFLSLTSAPQLS
jgi:hypothetical protein